MHGFCHAEILIPIFHSFCKECLRLWPHLVHTHTKKETFAFSESSKTKTFPERNVQREVGLCQTLANFGRSKSTHPFLKVSPLRVWCFIIYFCCSASMKKPQMKKTYLTLTLILEYVLLTAPLRQRQNNNHMKSTN